MIDQRDITLSEILDVVYCKRRWYLHTIEGYDASNVYMTYGKIEHETVDKSKIFVKDNLLSMTNVAVHSDKYNLFGLCDLVEFYEDLNGISIPQCDYNVKLVPVEYKHGKVRTCNEYIAQVVAQAICLEEMYSCEIDTGYIYFVDADDRYEIKISDAYRHMVIDAVSFIQTYDFVPVKAFYSRKCRGCSVSEICASRKSNISDYLDILWNGGDQI